MMQYSNPYSFEKTECVGKKLKNIAPNIRYTKLYLQQAYLQPVKGS